MVSLGHKLMEEQFNLVEKVLFVGCQSVASVNHTNNGAAEDIGCVAAGRRETEVKILWFFKNFSTDFARCDRDSKVHEINSRGPRRDFPGEGAKGVHQFLELGPVEGIKERI